MQTDQEVRPDQAENDQVISSKAAAEVLGVAEDTMRYWRTRGAGPRCFKLGRRVVYRRSEVVRWLEAQEAATGMGGDAA